jgi:hypothetical protein
MRGNQAPQSVIISPTYQKVNHKLLGVKWGYETLIVGWMENGFLRVTSRKYEQRMEYNVWSGKPLKVQQLAKGFIRILPDSFLRPPWIGVPSTYL